MRRKSLLLFLFWFALLLPLIRLFLSGLTGPPPRITLYSETADDLSFLIDRERAFFPSDFNAIHSQWENASDRWAADWHVYIPYLKQSIEELDNFEVAVTPASVKGKSAKKKSGQMTPQDFWAQVYSHLGNRNVDRVENIARAFLWFSEKNGLSDRELLDLVISYIQQIPYELPDNRYGLYTPPQILDLGSGDCDSKSVYAAVLLTRLGYDVALFYSSEYRHAMLGVNVPSMGVYKELDGRSYYFTEMTAPGWQIGDIPPDCSDPDYWFISKL